MSKPLHIAARKETPSPLDELLRPVAEELAAVKKVYHDYLLTGRGGHDIDFLAHINQAFKSNAVEAPIHVIEDVAHHLLQREGKWIRAALVQMVAKMFGRTGDDTAATAATVELIHVATLIHDDLVDSAEYRRGQKSIPANWGVSISVLMGDFIYAKAFALLAELDCPEAIRAIARSTRDVALGELQEMRFFGENPVTEEEYFRMIHNKTASLFGACAEAGAHLAWMDAKTAESCRQGAVALGMAFQIADDVLDLSSTASELGKDVDADWKNGKVTLPLLYLRERRPEFFDATTTFDARDLRAALDEFKCLERATQIAESEAARARAAFQSAAEHVRNSDCFDSLTALCEFVVQRRR